MKRLHRIAASFLPTAAALCVPSRACVVDQDAAHQLGSDAEELRTRSPAGMVLDGKAHVQLVDQPGRLQRVAGSLPAHLGMSEPAQFDIEELDQTVERPRVTLAPGVEQRRDVFRG